MRDTVAVLKITLLNSVFVFINFVIRKHEKKHTKHRIFCLHPVSDVRSPPNLARDKAGPCYFCTS